jgi:hypothetical protein
VESINTFQDIAAGAPGLTDRQRTVKGNCTAAEIHPNKNPARRDDAAKISGLFPKTKK